MPGRDSQTTQRQGGTYSVDGVLVAPNHELSAAAGLCECGGEREEVHWGRGEVRVAQASEVLNDGLLQLLCLHVYMEPSARAQSKQAHMKRSRKSPAIHCM